MFADRDALYASANVENPLEKVRSLAGDEPRRRAPGVRRRRGERKTMDRARGRRATKEQIELLVDRDVEGVALVRGDPRGGHGLDRREPDRLPSRGRAGPRDLNR